MFYELKVNHTASFLLLAASALLIILAFGTMATARWVMLLWTGILFFLMAAVLVGKSWMKKRGFSRNANRTLSVGISVVLTIALLGILTAGMIRIGFPGRSRAVGTYDYGGWKMDVYADTLPLYLQDLTDMNWEEWSTHARKEETFWCPVRNTHRGL